jgi:hypothetical protein
MLRTDTGNFNRFLTSLGLLLLAAALVIPYFYFRNTDILIIPNSDLQALTERGRSAVVERQNAIAALEPWVIGGACLLGITGAVLLVAGGLRLRAAQESEDEETELRKDRARLEMKSLSPEERAERVVEKAREEPDAGAPIPGEAQGPRSAGESATEVRLEQKAPDDFLRERRQAVARIEKAIDDAFKAFTLANYRLKLQLKISSTTDAIQLDGVFEARDDRQPDVVLKTRVAFNPDFTSKTARSSANDLIAQLSRYQSMTHRAADGWLVAIVPAESEANLNSKAVSADMESLNSALGSFGKALVIREMELDKLPQLFTAEFGHTFLL